MKLQELVGVYPLIRDIESTEEYKNSVSVAINSLDKEWEPIETAAEVLYKKLDRPYEFGGARLGGELKEIKSRELHKLKAQIKIESCVSHNIRKIGEIIAFADPSKFTPLLVTNYIKYIAEWESWSLGAGEDHGSDLVSKKEFSQALDFSLEEEIARLGISGEITLLKGKPQLRIRAASLKLMGKPWSPLEYLKNQGLARPVNKYLDNFRKQKRTSNLQGFYLDTKISPDDFFSGKPVIDFWKNYSPEEIQRNYSTQEEGYINFVKGVKQVARIISSQIGKVPCHLQKGSEVYYDFKTGKPMEKKLK